MSSSRTAPGPTVLFVSGEYPPDHGGVADYTRLLAEGLAARGQAVHVATGRRGGGARAGVTVHPDVKKWGPAGLNRIGALASRLGARVVHLQYQAAAFDLSAWVCLLPWSQRLRKGAPVVVTLHDLLPPFMFPKAGALRQRLVYAMAGRAAAAVATNEADLEVLAHHGVRAHLVPIGSNIPPAPPALFDRAEFRRREGLESGPVLVYFGFLNATKGGLDLIAALGELRRTLPETKLVLLGAAAGKSDPTNVSYAHQVEMAIAAAGLEGAVRRTGPLEPDLVSAWLMAADAAVLPYRDGASYRRGSLLAALAHGTPVVTTRPAGPSRRLPALVDGDSALLVTPAEPGALAEAVRRLVHSQELAPRLSAGARRVAAAFSWDAIAAEHLELYQAVAPAGFGR